MKTIHESSFLIIKLQDTEVSWDNECQKLIDGNWNYAVAFPSFAKEHKGKMLHVFYLASFED